MNSKKTFNKAAQFVKGLFVKDPYVGTELISDEGKHYFLKDRVGMGGMGAVYKAADQNGREVAVKITISEPGVKRFKLETAILKLLGDHPHLPRLIDWGLEKSEVKFCVMEFIRGEELDDIIRNQTPWFYQNLSFNALEVASGLLTALNHVHNKKVVHRDIKPHNIFIIKKDNGELAVKLMDFGVAKALEKSFLSFLHRSIQFDEKALTMPGEPIGTLGYAPPEQIDNSEPDESADIFSCAITIYEMFFGGFLFRGGTLSKYLAELENFEYKPLQMYFEEGNFPQQNIDKLNAILKKALSLNPKHRYRRAGKILKDINALKKVWKKS